jgi:hypothetical protein
MGLCSSAYAKSTSNGVIKAIKNIKLARKVQAAANKALAASVAEVEDLLKFCNGVVAGKTAANVALEAAISAQELSSQAEQQVEVATKLLASVVNTVQAVAHEVTVSMLDVFKQAAATDAAIAALKLASSSAAATAFAATKTAMHFVQEAVVAVEEAEVLAAVAAAAAATAAAEARVRAVEIALAAAAAAQVYCDTMADAMVKEREAAARRREAAAAATAMATVAAAVLSEHVTLMMIIVAEACAQARTAAKDAALMAIEAATDAYVAHREMELDLKFTLAAYHKARAKASRHASKVAVYAVRPMHISYLLNVSCSAAPS